MQWVPMADHPGYLAAAFDLLRPGGWFRLEMGGAGNIPVIAPMVESISLAHGGPPAPWSFPDAGTYLELLERAGFTVDREEGSYVRTVGQRRPFDRDSLLGWLRSQCYQGFEISMPAEQHAAFEAEVEARLDELRRHDGTFDQTYVRLDVLARKPSSPPPRPSAWAPVRGPDPGMIGAGLRFDGVPGPRSRHARPGHHRHHPRRALQRNVARWVVEHLTDHDLDVELVDLRDHPLPFFDGAAPARTLRDYARDDVAEFGRTIDRADGYIVLTAERSPTGTAWQRSPLTFPHYGTPRPHDPPRPQAAAAHPDRRCHPAARARPGQGPDRDPLARGHRRPAHHRQAPPERHPRRHAITGRRADPPPRARPLPNDALVVILARHGYLTGAGRPFDVKAVQWVRRVYGIPYPSPVAAGEVSVKDAARQLGSSPGVVYYWIETGQLEARRGTGNRLCVTWAPGTEAECRARIAASGHINPAARRTRPRKTPRWPAEQPRMSAPAGII